MQSLTGFNLSYASGKGDRQGESAFLVHIGLNSLKTKSLRFPLENRPLQNDLNFAQLRGKTTQDSAGWKLRGMNLGEKDAEDGGGEKMREEERWVKKETAWPMQLPAATRDPGEPQVLLKGVFKINPRIHSIREVHSRSLTFLIGDR
ncbi:unnamed protein product [Leuciscus chuanchicus]